jgi:hypothetical protein
MSVHREGGGASPRRWCPVCGTAHGDPMLCPGELRATGAERPGWRVQVETPLGHEAIGVLVAPCRDLWRARVLTYPNVLWTLPGGRATIKFVGAREPEETGRVLYIHLDVRGHTLPLRGLVMWRRARTAAGRPVGMGIRLTDPPPFYRSVVEATV